MSIFNSTEYTPKDDDSIVLGKTLTVLHEIKNSLTGGGGGGGGVSGPVTNSSVSLTANVAATASSAKERKFLIIQNPSSNQASVWVRFDDTATKASPSVELVPGQTISFVNFVPNQAISLISSSAISVTVWEG